jgi:integrase
MKGPPSVPSAIADYLKARRQLGFALEKEGRVLDSLARYARQTHHRGPLTTAWVLRWAQQPQPADPLWWARRLAIARQFAQFWVAFDPRTQVPPAGFFGPSHRRPPVHIYRASEITALLGATTTLGPPDGLRGATFGTLFGLLACTGLRLSEALRLRSQDLDPAPHTLRVQAIKSSPARSLPVPPSTSQALHRYDRLCQQKLRASTRPALFLNAQGQPLSRDAADRVFQHLRDHLGWTQPPIPRLYDLRHTFAVGCLVRWNRQPGELNAKILALSAYLGHRHVTDTYWYFTAIPQWLAASGARFEQLVHLTHAARL